MSRKRRREDDPDDDLLEVKPGTKPSTINPRDAGVNNTQAQTKQPQPKKFLDPSERMSFLRHFTQEYYKDRDANKPAGESSRISNLLDTVQRLVKEKNRESAKKRAMAREGAVLHKLSCELLVMLHSFPPAHSQTPEMKDQWEAYKRTNREILKSAQLKIEANLHPSWEEYDAPLRVTKTI